MDIDLAKIPSGEFVMGREFKWDNMPLVRMIVSKPFWMSRTLITQKQWFSIMKSRPWRTTDEEVMAAEGFVEDDECPAVCVSKQEAEAFAERLGAKTKKRYKLPTEVQWEYAYRAGTKTRYFWGDKPTGFQQFAWCCEEGKPRPKDLKLPAVGLLKPNPWGLYDMAGLTLEWVRDQVKTKGLELAKGHYPEGGVDFWSQDGPNAILRNGSYVNRTDWIDATFKLIRSPESKLNAWGFRVVREEE